MYFKQLDFLRFVAVSLVITEHWFQPHIGEVLMFGRLGVLLFYTISGFLITNILLKAKARKDAGTLSAPQLLKTFYIRRTFRIFPIYYLMLLFLFAFSLEGIRHKIGWYGLYGSNIYSYVHQHWDGSMGPYWSLAVEEQFYLVWPFLLLATPAKHLLKFFFACILIAPIFRLISVTAAFHFSASPSPMLAMIVLTPDCLDLFAIGGLLAFALRDKAAHPRLNSFFSDNRVIAVAAAGSFVLLLFKDTYIHYALFPTVFAVLSAWVINKLVQRVNGVPGKVIEMPIFLYLGKISYGIYLYHASFGAIMSMVDFALLKAGTKLSLYNSLETLNAGSRTCVWLVYLVIIASLSYFLIENPINRLKEKFTY
jgi:peptidoglycan/LPS O-acetylase OafA/YrhL